MEQESPQKKKSMKKKPVPGQLHSVLTNADIQKQIVTLKKKTLVLQIALMGFNVHMAEYILEHNQLNYNLPQNTLMNQVIEKVLEIENTISELKRKRQEKLMVFDDSIDNHSIDESILLDDNKQKVSKDHLKIQKKNNRITTNEMKIKKLFYGLSEKYQQKPVVRQTQKHLHDNPKDQFLTTNNQKQPLIPHSIGFSDVKFEEIPEHEMCMICMSKLTHQVSLSCQHFFCG